MSYLRTNLALKRVASCNDLTYLDFSIYHIIKFAELPSRQSLRAY